MFATQPAMKDAEAFAGGLGGGWLHGLKVVAVAVVAQAVWGMAKALCPDRERATLAILTAILTFVILGLERYGFRPLEAVITAFVGVIALLV